jgi:hypothetical protein
MKTTGSLDRIPFTAVHKWNCSQLDHATRSENAPNQRCSAWRSLRHPAPGMLGAANSESTACSAREQPWLEGVEQLDRSHFA